MSNFDVSQMGTTQKGSEAPPSDLLSELVGEGKKFKTVEDLARGKLEADSFIQRITQENKALREAMDNDTPDVVLAKINGLLSTRGSENTANQQASNQSQSKEPSLEEKVLTLLNSREMEQNRKKNVETFNQTVNRAFGDKTADVVATRLTELDMDPQLFNTMVEKNPQAALKVLGLKEPAPSQSTLQGSAVNTEAYFGNDNKGGEKQNFAYFNKLRRELKEGYYTPEVQKQVFEARKKLGEDFWKA